jgi:hypothetical protein
MPPAYHKTPEHGKLKKEIIFLKVFKNFFKKFLKNFFREKTLEKTFLKKLF